LRSFSNSSWVNTGFKAASAINSKTLGKYLESEFNRAPELEKDTLAPKKSISSLKASFDIFLEPVPNKLPAKLVVPAFSPSKIGGLSIVKDTETLGNL
jgi:hypothetical protein